MLVPLVSFTQPCTQIPMLVLCMSHIVPELYLSSCATDPETLKEGEEGGTLLSFSCKKLVLRINITILRRSNKMQLPLSIFLLMAASAPDYSKHCAFVKTFKDISWDME